ncbi:MAG: hypothetical protein F4X61_01655 [Rhodothermaceae bacterium]|nr:hypothetical protein [Rhodothermaceae bacterium]MYC03324.1 hypothetical protein [Rhodothermaceae bacterium]
MTVSPISGASAPRRWGYTSLNVPAPLKSALFAALDRKEETVRFQVWKTLVNEYVNTLPHVVTEYESALALLEPIALSSL